MARGKPGRITKLLKQEAKNHLYNYSIQNRLQREDRNKEVLEGHEKMEELRQKWKKEYGF